MPTFLANLISRRAALLLALCGTFPGAADLEWPKPEVKIRTAFGGGQRDMLRGGMLGFGFNLSGSTAWGNLGFELGYSYKTGDQYIGLPQAAVAGMAPVDTRNSAERKANDLQGLAARLSLTRPLGWEGWSWQAGLMIGGARFRQEMVGDCRSTPWGATATPLATTWRDTYNATPEEGGFKTSPFLGAKYRVNHSSSLELNLLVLNYTAVDYLHLPGSGTYTMGQNAQGTNIGMISTHNGFAADRLARSTRWWPHLELGWTWHF